MHVKVTNTVSLQTSQGDVIVTKGKLVLIKTDNRVDINTKLALRDNKLYNNLSAYDLGTLSNITGKRPNESDFYTELQPIIISETDHPEIGDKIMSTCILHDGIGTVSGFNKRQYYINESNLSISDKKILALPEHFTPKQLQAIVDGKMKDGDEVYIECVDNTPKFIPIDKFNSDALKQFGYFIKLNSDNHITLHKVEQKTYTKDEVIEMCKEYWRAGAEHESLARRGFSKEAKEYHINSMIKYLTNY